MYHNMAFPMGVIQGNSKNNITPWLCYKFLNCLYNPSSANKFSISLSDSWGVGDKMVFHQQIQLFNDSYDIIGIDIIQLLENMIANGHYVVGNYNEEFIPGKQTYGTEYFVHDYLLIGFDKEQEVFHSVGYLTNQFVDFEIPYTNMRNALTSLSNKKPVLNFYKYNDNADFAINIEKTMNALQDYLSSSNSLRQYTKGLFYGLDAIDKLGDYYQSNSNKDNFDHRYTRGLMEHKHIMLKRIEYLCTHQYVTDDKCVAKARMVHEYSAMIHNLGIKFKLIGDYKIISEIKSIIQEMKSVELSYLVSIKNDLELYLYRKDI